MRILLYTGKGGVGKTSISAATAVRCAELGYRTAVISTDPAHSLGDSFDRRIGSQLVELGPNLWGQEIDLLSQMDQYWGTVLNYLNALFAWQGMDSLVAEETADLRKGEADRFLQDVHGDLSREDDRFPFRLGPQLGGLESVVGCDGLEDLGR